jgi:hypothetical protein
MHGASPYFQGFLTTPNNNYPDEIGIRRWGWLSVLILSLALIVVGLPGLGVIWFGFGGISEKSLETS